MNKNIIYPAYLSEQAIQALLKQIPRSELKFIASELGIDVQALSLKLPSELNERRQALFSQAQAIVSYLEKYHPNQIGTVDYPRTYVQGTLTMFSHFLARKAERPEFSYFGGSTPQTIVGLAGAASSMIVSVQTEVENKNGSRLSSTLPFLLEVLASDLEISSNRFYLYDPGINLALAFYTMRALNENGRPGATYSFFAQVKLDSEHVPADLRPGKHLLLASPLYIINEWRV